MTYNFRQLAHNVKNKDSKKIKKDHLVRSAYPNELDDKQLDTVLNLDKIFDLRGTEEIAEDPEIHLENVNTINYKIGGDFQNQEKTSLSLEFALRDINLFYEQILQYSDELKQLFADLKNDKSKILFHCTAGKDRTGTIGILMMNILDFEEQDIIDEYLTIDPQITKSLEDKLTSRGITVTPEISKLLSVNIDFYNSLKKGILNNYDSIDDYIKNYLKISDADKLLFKDYYLH